MLQGSDSIQRLSNSLLMSPRLFFYIIILNGLVVFVLTKYCKMSINVRMNLLGANWYASSTEVVAFAV